MNSYKKVLEDIIEEMNLRIKELSKKWKETESIHASALYDARKEEIELWCREIGTRKWYADNDHRLMTIIEEVKNPSGTEKRGIVGYVVNSDDDIIERWTNFLAWFIHELLKEGYDLETKANSKKITARAEGLPDKEIYYEITDKPIVY